MYKRQDLKGIIDDDELHLIVLLLDKVQYSVKLEGQTGEPFSTNVGSPQGDGASALFFIIYLALSLLILQNKQKEKAKELSDHTYNKEPGNFSEITPNHLKDHTYCKTSDNYVTIDQQYADDIGWASTGIHILENIERKIPDILQSRNLHINRSKTCLLYTSDAADD